MTTFGAYLNEAADVVQSRGICQICGREQAVRSQGNITHHGYTIQYGWFHGTCPGQQHKPLQFDKSETERQIALIKKELPLVKRNIEKLKSGKMFPKEVRKSERRSDRDVMVPFAEADVWMQRRAVELAILREDQRYRNGVSTIDMLEKLIVTYYGKELKKITRAEVTKPVMGVGSVVNVAGEKNVTITKIEKKRVQGVSHTMNGDVLDHVFWTDSKGRERSYPMRLARFPK